MSVYKFRVETVNNAVKVDEENFHPKSAGYEDENIRVIVLGYPILNGKPDKIAAAKYLAKGVSARFIRELDGSFLFIVHDKREGSLIFINDRFASIPFFYYFADDRFVGSVNYAEIWDELAVRGRLSINKNAFYEFICLQRLVGDKTYDLGTKYLDSAVILKYDICRGTVKIEKYWNPYFSKRKMPKKDVSRALAELTADSLRERASDGKRYGLLLSGGLDSRLILAAADRPLSCVTVGFYENNECAVAKELAAAKGYPHHFVKRPEGYYGDIISEASFLGGAMNVYANAHFLGFEEKLRPIADVFFHGHGFDYLFQGKYISHETLKILGRRTFINKITKQGGNIGRAFLGGISYRLKSAPPPHFLKDEKKAEMETGLYDSINAVVSKGAPYCNDAYDMWEYLNIHNLSRHYTFLNFAGIRTFAEERTVVFDNQLFDLYLSLSKEDRFNRAIFADAIRLLDDGLSRIRNANTNFGIYDSGVALTAKVASNKILGLFGLRVKLPPGKGERSWPSGPDFIKDAKIRKRTERLPVSSIFDTLDFIDREKVKTLIGDHLNGRKDHSDIILRFLTIDAFMNDRKGAPVCQDVLL